MAQNILDVMTPNPFLVSVETPVAVPARMMRDADVGSLIVLKGGAVHSIVTDRDIVIRVVAAQRDAETTSLREVCSKEPIMLSLHDTVDQAIAVMHGNSIRRLPVLDEKGRPAGIVSLGDLAIERDPGSALAPSAPRSPTADGGSA